MLGLASALGPGGVAPEGEAVVTSASVELVDRADDTAFTTGEAVRGDVLEVREALPDGWLAVAPPADQLDWIDKASLTPLTGGKAKVVVERTPVRSGCPDARLPGPTRLWLTRGAVVRLSDHPPLNVRLGDRRRTLLAIRPVEGELRFVRREGLRVSGPARKTRRASAKPAEPPSPELAIAPEWMLPDSSNLDALPPEAAEELRRLDAEQRSIMRRSPDDWRLDSLRAALQETLDRYQDSATRAEAHRRIAYVDRARRLSADARKLQALLNDDAERARTNDSDVDTPQTAPFDAQGMLQVSSKLYEGTRVYALIGDDGATAAYLKLPPGIPGKRFLTHRVGVRGSTRYDEALRAKVIDVEDLEPLREAP